MAAKRKKAKKRASAMHNALCAISIHDLKRFLARKRPKGSKCAVTRGELEAHLKRAGKKKKR